MTDQRCDVLVVGGGMVGLATALALLEAAPGRRVVLLEKETAVARHQSGHNSGVVHSGIAYRPGALKSELTLAGKAATLRLCEEEGLPVRRPGKVLVATTPAELLRLGELGQRATQVGIAATRWGPQELTEREPAVIGLGALHLPQVACVDYPAIAAVLVRRVSERGGLVELGTRVVGIHEVAGEVVVEAVGPAGPRSWRAGHLVGCAGLQSDRIATLAGLDPPVRIVPFRGEYYRLPEHRSALVRSMIYPVPDPDVPFLGVHLTPSIDGSTTIGPNAVLGLSREGYRKRSVDARDLADIATFPGIYRVARGYWRQGLTEMAGSASRRAYLRMARRLVPGLQLSDLQPALAGIRAQAVRPDGTFVHDFLISSTDRMTHVLNAPSPAATAALPIGQRIAEQVLGRAGSRS